jgi:RNA-directed DNA polymerase
MREPYVEGLATHDGPESCIRIGNGAGEALTGGRAGWLLSREIGSLGCRRRNHRRKATSPAALVASCRGTPRGPWNLCMRGTFMRENREVPCSPVAVIRWRAARGRLRSYA